MKALSKAELDKWNQQLDEQRRIENVANLSDLPTGEKLNEVLQTRPSLTIVKETIKNLETQLDSAIAIAEKRKSKGINPLTDLGNLERFISLYGDKICYIPEENDFFYYSGKRWEKDLQGAKTHEYIDLTVRGIYTEAGQLDNEAQRKTTADWAKRSENKQRRDAIYNDLKHKTVKSIKEFDKDPWLFNVQNGTINLKTGKYRPHNPDDYILKISPVTYDPQATCSLWVETLRLFFQDQTEIINYIQKLYGYTLCGVKSERLVVYLYGRGRNGKSTITGTPLQIFGDYGCAADISTFLDSRWGRQAGAASEDIARLNKMRYVRATEIGAKDKLNEKFIKDISGQDIVTARNPYGRSFDFLPNFTLWLYGNEIIKIEGQDTGIKDRVKFVPLLYEIPLEKEDRTMRTRLFKEEGPGILNWLIEGCVKWQTEGLQEPEEIIKATNNFFNEQDPIGQFIKDCCMIADNASVKYSSLYAAFIEYSDVQLSKQRFSKYLKNNNFDIIPLTDNQKYITGLELIGNS